MKAPWIIAHRGSSSRAPENTLAAFQQAILEKADGLEFDVWKCGSGEVVVTHNREVGILSGRPGNLEKMSFRDLRRLDFGLHKSPQFRGQKIPTLNEVLDLARGLAVINVEIKGTSVRSKGIELDVVEAILRFRLLRKTVVSSFNPAILLRVQRLNPAIRTGLLLYEKSPLPLRRGWTARFLRPYSLHPSVALLKEELVERTHRQGKKVIAWTVNDLQALRACIRCEVDGIITDDPAWARDALQNV